MALTAESSVVIAGGGQLNALTVAVQLPLHLVHCLQQVVATLVILPPQAEAVAPQALELGPLDPSVLHTIRVVIVESTHICLTLYVGLHSTHLHTP